MSATYNLYRFYGRGASGKLYEMRMAATETEFKEMVTDGLMLETASLLVASLPTCAQLDAMIERTQLAQHVEPHSLRN